MLTSENTCSVEEVVEKYSSVLAENYEKQQKALLDILFQSAKLLKKEIALFKREVSAENIQKLITDKRREKERERQHLENRWRQCNESFKALQEEQKKLINQQKEGACDLKNLRTKIEQFKCRIAEMKIKVGNKQDQKQAKFLTEAKQNYESPQKIPKTIPPITKPQNQKSHQTLANSSTLIFANKYNPNSLNSCDRLKLNHESRCNFANSTESSRYDSQFLKTKGQSQLCKYRASERKSHLEQFLNDPAIRLKLFKIIKKPI